MSFRYACDILRASFLSNLSIVKNASLLESITENNGTVAGDGADLEKSTVSPVNGRPLCVFIPSFLRDLAKTQLSQT